MPRVTNAAASRRRRRRRLDAAKGFRGSRSKLIRTATEAVDRAMSLATIHRRERKREFRRLWIARISAACKANDMTYSKLMHGLDRIDVRLNRKMLSEVAIHDPAGFSELVAQAKAGLE